MVTNLRRRPRARGFTYLLLMFLVVLLGVGLASAGVVWDLRSRRDKEADLLFIGAQFRRAIDAYYDGSPTATKEYPRRFEDLLEDRRFANPRRHLRRVYRDPFTLKEDWGLIVIHGRLVGVYSLASGVPVKRGGFTGPESEFASAGRYADWRFVALNLASSPPADPAAVPPPPGVPVPAPGRPSNMPRR
jgi:type II secretory pathway pseudopilin PulG